MSTSSTIYRSTLNHHRSIRQAVRRTSRAIMEEMEARCLLSAALAPDHIVVVIERNRASGAVGDTVDMPYFNQLASTGLVYTNAHSVAPIGQVDSLALYSGSTQGVTQEGWSYSFSGQNIAASLNSTQKNGQYLSFAGYSEALPADGDATTTTAGDPNDPTAPPDLYSRAVNPMAQFDDAGQHGSVALTNAEVNKTFASFPTTAAGYASLPTVSFVVPDCLHNAHGSNEQAPWAGDPGDYDSLRFAADTWVQNNLGGYVQWAKTHNSLIIVVSDTEETDAHPTSTITCIVNGDQALFAPGVNTASVNDYNLVRTIEDMYGLTPIGDTGAVSALATDAQGRLATSVAGLGATTTSLISSLPASTLGQSVTFTATVTANAGGASTPTGTITFNDGTTILGTGAINASGQATFTTSTLSAGTHSIVAAYGGDSAFTTSTSPTITQTVGVPNDNFASRTVITGTTVSTTGSNAGASKETGEPNHAGDTGGKSVWWTWTAPSSGTVTIDTIGSNFDTTLGVYTGTAVSALTLVAGDDDGGGGNASKVSFAATAGTAYQIAVDGYAGRIGNILLNVNLSTPVAVANDNFANRTVISGAAVTTTGSNAGATKEAGEPNHAGNAGGKSVWWTWTAPSSGTVTIDTIGSNFDTTLGVYTGTSVSALTFVSGDDDSGGSNTSQVSFAATAGTVYQIAVDGYGGLFGNIALHVNLPTALAPANDNFVNRTALSGAAATATGSNDGATKEAGEPDHAGNAGGKSVWWTWTAPSSGTVTIDTIGSDFDTTLGAYTGTSVSALTLVAGDDDSGGNTTSEVSFAATAGTAYQIAVDGYGGFVGNIVLHANLTTALAPANDNFVNRTTISGTTATGSNDGATKESGEPDHAGNAGGKSVWWTWTAPSSGTVTIDTIGSDFDTTLGAYTGTSVSALTLVAGDDDSGGNTTSEVSFAATAGTAYQIAVDGYGGFVGNIVLNISTAGVVAPLAPTGVAASNGAFTDRVRITWTTAANAAGYEVWRNTADNSAAATKLNSADITGTSYDDTTAVAGTTYWYWVKAKNSGGTSGFSDSSSGHASVAAPQAPTNVAASDGTFTDKVSITWTAAANAEGYEVWRYTANDSTLATKISAADVTSTAFDDTTATAGTTYWYWVKAKNTGGTSGFSTGNSGYAAAVAPQAPTGVAASDGTFTDKVRITWTAAANATGYEVWRNTANNSASATKISAADVTSTTFDDTTATAGTTYWYWVTARNSGGTSGFSTSNSGYTVLAPHAPTGVAASDGTYADKVRITWTAAASAAGYEVWRSTSNSSGSATKISAADITGTSFDDATATRGTTYWYWVKAKNSGGTSGFSTGNSGYATPVAPQAPTAVTASDGTFTDRVRITWTAAATATGYEVWRSTSNSSGSATKISAADITGTSFNDTTAIRGITYWYWVKAKNSGGASGFSNGDSGRRA